MRLKNLGSVQLLLFKFFLKEVSYAHQGCIYFKTEVFLQIGQIHKLQTVFYFKMYFLCNISYYYQC